MNKDKLHTLFHATGLSCSVGLCFTMFYILFKILTEGYFWAIEPRLPVVVGEIGIALFGLYYTVYKIAKFGDSQ